MGELGGICEPNPSLRAILQEKLPGVSIAGDLQQALLMPGIEAAVVATPVVTHRDVAEQCLRAGKHVLVEKPMSLRADEAAALVRLADDCNRQLAVGHLLMYHPALHQLKVLMGQGALGEIRAVQCTRVNLGKIRNEENAWWSLAPHDLSIISFLLEEPLQTVQAFRLNPLQREDIEDTVYASFQTLSGKEASIHVSWLSPYKKHETLVVGTEAIAVFDDTLPPEQKLTLLPYSLDRAGEAVYSVSKKDALPVVYEAGPDLLTREAEALLQLIRGERQTIPNDGHNGLQVVQLLEEVQTRLKHQNRVLEPV